MAQSLGLESCTTIFAERGGDREALCLLTDTELEKLGVCSYSSAGCDYRNGRISAVLLR